MLENLGFGCLGNGITVWDKNRYTGYDYKTVAHIQPCGVYKLFEPLSKEATQKIVEHATRTMEAYRKDFLRMNRYRAVYALDAVMPASVPFQLEKYQSTEQIYDDFMKYSARHGYQIPPTAEN